MNLEDPVEPFRATSKLFERVRSDYEHRPQQEKMARSVEESIRTGRILLVEAGTGVGKTLAYLFPLLFAAAREGLRVAVSTETRSLQRQMLEKDIPVVEAILGRRIRTEICLGASNFLCKSRLKEVVESGSLEGGMSGRIDPFLEWADATQTGILSEYNGFTTPSFMKSVCRDADECRGRRCPYFDESFYFLAREKWKQADLLILNHSLLSSHILLDRKLLPEFEYLVVDEAHRFPSIFADSMRRESTFHELLQMLRMVRADSSSTEIFSLFQGEFVNNYPLFPGQVRRLREPVPLDSLRLLLERMEDLQATLRDRISELSEEREKEQGLSEGAERLLGDELMRHQIHLRSLEGYSGLLKDLRSGPGEERVHWISRSESDTKMDYNLHAAPLRSESYLKRGLLDPLTSVVFTSATLTGGDTRPFDYFRSELGLMDETEPGGSRDVAPTPTRREGPSAMERTSVSVEEEERGEGDADARSRLKLLKLDSPFDYRRRSILFLPESMPDPSGSEEAFHREAALWIRRLTQISGGGAFVLFTSVRSLKEIHRIIREEGGVAGSGIQSQVEMGPARALRAFHESENGVLFGLSTFWQGIDIPGEKLRLVILVRLPFRPPEDPVMEARIDLLRSSGKNPFMTLQLPQAVISIKQGFGRLIRTGSDRGAVAILDPRLITKRYGSTILSSLPPARRIRNLEEFQREFLGLFSLQKTE